MDDFVAELVGYVESEGTVSVINLPLLFITQDAVGVIDLLKHFFCFGIVWVFVRVVFEGQPLVLPPNLVMRRLLGNVKQLVEAVSASRESVDVTGSPRGTGLFSSGPRPTSLWIS